ncbi:D-3-phosphoglycerate dehydrogenase [Acetobacter malorum]|nr:D-3-phosphoglycerate dehydrogenase [Acetobacter malorum]
MVCLVIKQGGSAALPEWKALFARLMPELEVRDWNDPTVDPAHVDYALVWKPDPGRLAKMVNLKAILSAAVGVDHITCDPTWPKNVPLIRMGGEEPVMQMEDYVLWAAFSILRDAASWRVGQQDKVWTRQDASARTSAEITIGVMGLGSLGAPVAMRLARAGFQVSGWARHAKTLEGVTCYAGAEGLSAFLHACDTLVCLLPETPETTGMVTYDLLAQLRKPAGLINVGRGPLVVEADLLRALNDGTLHTAVLDVFDKEPLPASSPLWAHPRVLITPHAAADASRPARAAYVASVIEALERGKDVPLRYDPAKGY